MDKRALSILLIMLISTFTLFGCKEDTKAFDRQLIVDNTITVEALLPSDSKISEDINIGMFFAGDLANSVNLGENINVDYGSLEYTDEDDIVALAQNLVDNGASAIIYSGDNYNTFKNFTAFVDSTDVPVISLCPYSYEADNFFSLTLSPEYLSSCVATYVMEKGYANPLVIFESTNDYYVEFTDILKSTFLSYTSKEPEIIHKLSGDTDTYSAYTKHDFIFLATNDSELKEDVTDLRLKGFTGEIMLSEVLDKSTLNDEAFNYCSVITKFEADSSNNVATVFSSMFSETQGIRTDEISPATAYGYDAYMLLLEALKYFEPNDFIVNNSDTTSTTPPSLTDITLSDYSEAISKVTYSGVTDLITFENNSLNPTYIYVDNITGDKVVLETKYTFASK